MTDTTRRGTPEDPKRRPAASRDPASDRERLTTEQRNPASTGLDMLSARELVALMNEEDAGVHVAVAAAAPQITRAVNGLVECLQGGGRLLYVGAGTSGRLGVLDASECPPTFGTPPELVQGLIAGGPEALTRSREGAEDDTKAAVADLEGVHLRTRDAVVGISASGHTPYAVAAVRHARGIGVFTVGVCCNADTPLSRAAEVAIEVVTGPEVLTGSTRLKAGTATKMVLNMLSTATMVRLGRTSSNLMAHLNPASDKLVDRAVRIVMQLANVSREAAEQALRASGQDVGRAVKHLTG